jgi:putative transposase
MTQYIRTHRERWGVEPICRVLQFAPATYYAATTRPPSARRLREERLKPEITRVWTDNRRVYGADKVWAELGREGHPVARCTVERLMRELGIRGVARGKTVRTTVANMESQRPAGLVKRRFLASAPNRLWVADLTYVKTHSGWVFVAVIVDVFSRRVVGWQASIAACRPGPGCPGDGHLGTARRRPRSPHLPLRSRRQYTSEAYTNVLTSHGIRSSLSRPANCWDNAVAESFFSTLKLDLLYRHSWPTRATARSAIFEYIEVFYNRERRHSTLGNLSPADYESGHAAVGSA